MDFDTSRPLSNSKIAKLEDTALVIDKPFKEKK
jgi:hypothetical protein